VADGLKVEVRGVRELRKALKDVGGDAPKELAAGLAEAAEIVARVARPRVPVRTGRAVGSIKVRKQSAGAALAVGGTAAPYYPWLDFGGKVGRNKSIRRPFVHGGRYIYPALADTRDEVNAKVDDVLKRMAERAGFETRGDAARG
jgi:hypothetical protein